MQEVWQELTEHFSFSSSSLIVSALAAASVTEQSDSCASSAVTALAIWMTTFAENEDV
ncbi:hypothetical protein ABBQ38_000760 [Trebouxia sp. C0009 RCD-2024]